MIERIRDYEKKAPCRDAHKLYVVSEGVSSEPDYFDFFKGLSSNLEIITIPPIDGKTDPVKLMERAKEIFLGEHKQYTIDYAQGDTIWFVIDTDTWEKEGKVEQLRKFCEEQNKECKDGNADNYLPWHIGQSNPCFEIWLYYHFFDKKPVEDEVIKCTSFKEFVNNSISGGFDYQRDPVRIIEAIQNAKNNFKCENNLMAKYATQLYLLGNEIVTFVQRDVMRLYNKLK